MVDQTPIVSLKKSWGEGLVVALAIVGAGEPPNPVTSGTRHSNGTVSVRAPHDG